MDRAFVSGFPSKGLILSTWPIQEDEMGAQAEHVIDEDLVRHIAFLIRLDLSDAEVVLIASSCERSSATSTVSLRLTLRKSLHINSLMGRTQLRVDGVMESMARDDFLANAPQ